MGEKFGRYPDNPESAKEKTIERLVATRWETINESLKEFQEREAEDALNPERFMAEATEAWEKRHQGSEHIETMAPFDEVQFLLGLLIEQGVEWSAQKRAAVRRVLYGFTQQSVGAMLPWQQNVINETILSDRDIARKMGKPKEDEQKLIENWIQNTVGRGVKS